MRKVADNAVVDAETVEAEADQAAVGEVTSNAVATVGTSKPAPLGTFDVGEAPLPFEWVHMTYAVSKRAPKNSLPGEYYLGKNWEAKLTERGGSFDAIIVKAASGYKDWPTGVYNPDFRPQYYPNKEAAIAAGKRVDWADGEGGIRLKPEAAPYLQLFMLVKKPDIAEDESLFTIPLDGVRYAPAVMAFEKMNYRDAAMVILRGLQADRMLHMKEKDYVPTLLDYVYRIGSEEQEAKTGNRFTKFTIRKAVDNGKPVALTKAAKEDLACIISMATTTTSEMMEEPVDGDDR